MVNESEKNELKYFVKLQNYVMIKKENRPIRKFIEENFQIMLSEILFLSKFNKFIQKY